MTAGFETASSISRVFTKLSIMPFRRLTWFVVLVLPCMAALSGCGSREMYHVRGKVTYKDGTVPKGLLAVVQFTPTPNSTANIRKGASGPIDPSDGSFEMVTRMTGDGVHHGEYGVTFRILRDNTTFVSLVSPKYTSPTQPAFTVNVDHDISDLDYQIEKAEGVSETPKMEVSAGPGSGGPGSAGPGSVGPGT
jgi:hypothetical protein